MYILKKTSNKTKLNNLLCRCSSFLSTSSLVWPTGLLLINLSRPLSIRANYICYVLVCHCLLRWLVRFVHIDFNFEVRGLYTVDVSVWGLPQCLARRSIFSYCVKPYCELTNTILLRWTHVWYSWLIRHN